jgi:hypothetical protein
MVGDAAAVEVIKSWIERPVSWGGEIEPTPTESNLARFEAAQTLVTPLLRLFPRLLILRSHLLRLACEVATVFKVFPSAGICMAVILVLWLLRGLDDDLWSLITQTLVYTQSMTGTSLRIVLVS